MDNITYNIKSDDLQNLIINILKITKNISNTNTTLKEPLTKVHEPKVHEPKVHEQSNEPVVMHPIKSEEFNKFFNNDTKIKPKLTDDQRAKKNEYHRNYYKNNKKIKKRI